jgi:hypothetical protein
MTHWSAGRHVATTRTVKSDDEIGRLYGLPQNEFVAARNALAKDLRGTGEREQADAVAALEKPSALAWAVNQLRRAESDAVERLLAVADELRQAQAGSKADRVRELTEEQQSLVRALVRAAGQLDVSAATLDKVGAALVNASIDPESREALEQGRLVREPEPVGFGAFAGTSVKAPKGQAKADRAKEERRKEAEAEKVRRAEIAEARQDLEAAERAVRQAEKGLDAAKRDAEDARKRLDKLGG